MANPLQSGPRGKSELFPRQRLSHHCEYWRCRVQSHPVQQRLQRRWQLRFTASLRRTRTAVSSMCFCDDTSRRWLTPLRILLHDGCSSLAMDVLLSRGTWPSLCSSKTFPLFSPRCGCLCQGRLCCYLWSQSAWRVYRDTFFLRSVQVKSKRSDELCVRRWCWVLYKLGSARVLFADTSLMHA